MSVQLSNSVRSLAKQTHFCKDYALILRELQHFPLFVGLALLFPLCAAIFEWFGIGFLFGFLQTLTDPAGVPFQSGVRWFDVWVLGIEKSDLEKLIRVCLLILGSTWVRAILNYFSALYSSLAQTKLIERLQQRIKAFLYNTQLYRLPELSNVIQGETKLSFTSPTNLNID